MGAVTVVDEDRQHAIKIAKIQLCTYFPVVAKLDRTLSIDPELIQKVKNHVQKSNLTSAADLISDDLLGRFGFAGNPLIYLPE